MVPFNVHFDRFVQTTSGLDAVANELPFTLKPNGIGLVTDWLAGEIWSACYDPVTTGYSLCFALPSTTWSLAFAVPVTSWTAIS